MTGSLSSPQPISCKTLCLISLDIPIILFLALSEIWSLWHRSMPIFPLVCVQLGRVP
jgi:hypothetical protein